ncbi:hypothetical protein PR048_019962 [Dryococelus australis]|uniref:Uncharacterized protein n=1 Tax=Dryococelus australis TaxID=614101 RepID=A0ABQ9H511_9NEOP|nr:hypothetical protein PR048_019962 [Dryococelus australis]
MINSSDWAACLEDGDVIEEIPEKTRRPAASSGTIPTCENPVTRPGIEPGSPWWEASVLIAQPPQPLVSYFAKLFNENYRAIAISTSIHHPQLPIISLLAAQSPIPYSLLIPSPLLAKGATRGNCWRGSVTPPALLQPQRQTAAPRNIRPPAWSAISSCIFKLSATVVLTDSAALKHAATDIAKVSGVALKVSNCSPYPRPGAHPSCHVMCTWWPCCGASPAYVSTSLGRERRGASEQQWLNERGPNPAATISPHEHLNEHPPRLPVTGSQEPEIRSTTKTATMQY